MLIFNKIIEIIITLQIIIISTFVPVILKIPNTNNFFSNFEIPITYQLPAIILITLIFKRNIVINAFTVYLIVGLFFIPVFHEGGSLGYLLTANFGYLLGVYPLIVIIDKFKKIKKKNIYFDFIKYGILAISSMHFIGIIYSLVQSIYYEQSEILFYNFAKYSLSKYGYHLLMLTPITLLIKIFNNRYQR